MTGTTRSATALMTGAGSHVLSAKNTEGSDNPRRHRAAQRSAQALSAVPDQTAHDQHTTVEDLHQPIYRQTTRHPGRAHQVCPSRRPARRHRSPP